VNDSVILSIDQGTTNSKAIVVDRLGQIIARGSSPVDTRYPKPGWVEQDGQQIWRSVSLAIEHCLAQAGAVSIGAIAIANQRESVMAWHRQMGEPLSPVISWQCRRTAEHCEQLKMQSCEANFIDKTGLPIDPLFASTKIAWILAHLEPSIKRRHICIGTIDSWLIWQFSGALVHATDASNASRTQLFNIQTMQWDESICDLLGIDTMMLPKVYDSAAVYAKTADLPFMADGVPVASAVGDSHAALLGHGAWHAGDGKVTFGTGSSIMVARDEFSPPPRGLTTTVAWVLHGKPTYAFEGNITVSAAILPWVGTIIGENDVESLISLAQSVADSKGVSLVPGHVGLGAPYWDSQARGLISGLSFTTGRAHLARAAAESMALQVADVLSVIKRGGCAINRLFADGSPSQSSFLMELVANFTQQSLTISENTEASALGAAYLAGLTVGYFDGIEHISVLSRQTRYVEAKRFDERQRQTQADWQLAVRRAMQH